MRRNRRAEPVEHLRELICMAQEEVIQGLLGWIGKQRLFWRSYDMEDHWRYAVTLEALYDVKIKISKMLPG